jgi:hypothetical protein
MRVNPIPNLWFSEIFQLETLHILSFKRNRLYIRETKERIKNTTDRSNQVDANGNTVNSGDYIDAQNKVSHFQDAADPALVDQKKFNLNITKLSSKRWYTKVYSSTTNVN